MTRYPHPLCGTCVPGCPAYGLCHCGCGQRPSIASRNYAARNIRAGHPRVYVHGHVFKTDRMRHRRFGRWHRNGLSAAIVLADLAMLRRFYSFRELGARIGMSETWVRYVMCGRIRRISFEAARRISEAARGKRDQVRIPDSRAAIKQRQWRERRARGQAYRRCECGRTLVGKDERCWVCRRKIERSVV